MVYGWDISTSVVGLAVFKETGELVLSDYCDLRKHETILEKADHFREWLLYGRGVNTYPENHHFIEERLGGFSGGRTSAQVLMKLGAFNMVASYIIWTYLPETHRSIAWIHPSSWKSAMKHEGLLIPKGTDSEVKKKITLDFVCRKEPNFCVDLNRNDKPQPWNFDRADAYCIGKAGLKRLCTAKES